MTPNKPLNFVNIDKTFGFEIPKFENSGLAVIYVIVFVFSIYYLVKNYKAGTVNM
ncbi:MAG: hypothetical protein V4721_09355 [Bacteroidota bacterium]